MSNPHNRSQYFDYFPIFAMSNLQPYVRFSTSLRFPVHIKIKYPNFVFCCLTFHFWPSLYMYRTYSIIKPKCILISMTTHQTTDHHHIRLGSFHSNVRTHYYFVLKPWNPTSQLRIKYSLFNLPNERQEKSLLFYSDHILFFILRPYF